MDDPFNDAPTGSDANASSSRRDAYQVPNLQTGVSLMAPRGTDADDPGALVKYNCGDCSSEQRIPRGGLLRCTECGCRMFYKQRTERVVQFEAR